jgi:hypothetical protein
VAGVLVGRPNVVTAWPLIVVEVFVDTLSALPPVNR